MIGDRPKVLLPGGSGYLGRYVANDWARRGFEVVVLSRHSGEHSGAIRSVHWDGETIGPWAKELEGGAAVVNLAGKSVNCRYSARNRQEILASRIDSTRVLGEAIAACERPPPVWVNSASATIYRHALDRPMDEATGETGSGFSVDVCRRWEQTFFEAPTPRTRKVALRTAIVLGAGRGGAMGMFLKIARLGLGGTLGRGDQYVSWIHIEDFARSVQWAVEHPELEGPINCASPNPVPNREFMWALRKACGQPIGLPAARWMLEIGAFFLRTETELLLKSRRVVPARLLESGFSFQYPELEPALAQIVLNR
jgi:uncharacterized protein (TIGR01777 family)